MPNFGICNRVVFCQKQKFELGQKTLKNFPPLKIHNQDFPVIYKSLAKSRTLRLRYSHCGQQILITGPQFALRSQIEAFLQKSMMWLCTYFPQPKTYKSFTHDITFPFLGHDLTIQHHAARSSGILKEENILHVMCPLEDTQQLVLRWIKAQTTTYFRKIYEVQAPILDVTPTHIRLSDPKTRWGSCNSKGVISFSWRLALAPRDVSFYVAIHELCHLKEMNHSKAFWKLVESLCPDYQLYRQWLKQKGFSLHLWR